MTFLLVELRKSLSMCLLSPLMLKAVYLEIMLGVSALDLAVMSKLVEVPDI